MGSLLEISNELLHCITSYVEPFDLFSLSLSCHTLNDFVKGNKILHKEIYLGRYDDPSHLGEPDWEHEVHQNVKLENLLRCSDVQVKRRYIEDFVAGRIWRMMETAATEPTESRNIRLLNEYFDGQERSNRNAFLCSSDLFDQGGTEWQIPAKTLEGRRQSAKMHCLWGRPIDPVPTSRMMSVRMGRIGLPRDFFIHEDSPAILHEGSPAMNTRNSHPDDIPVHMVARGKVYDLAEYTSNSLWGPFMGDGSHRVDWEKVEAIMSVLGYNLAKFTERSQGRFPYIWAKTWVGATPHSFKSPPPAEPSAESELESSASAFFDSILGDFDENHAKLMKQPDPALESLDPYGVTGTWMRVVCFLDYNDLYHYNFHNEFGSHDDVGAGKLQRRPIDTEEGIITLLERLRVTRVEPPPEHEYEDGDDKPDPDFSNFKGQRLPIVHFAGDSKSLHASWDPNANSKIRGSVRQTPEGEIRWTTFSIFHGEERWRSEGIQIGGLKSARGVLGNWFDKDFDEHGPAGPTAFWKESDWLEEGRRSDGGVVAFF